MTEPQRRAASTVAAVVVLIAFAAACGSDEAVSERDKCRAGVPGERALLGAVVEPLVEPRFRDSMKYGDDCDSGPGAFLEWDVTGAASEIIATFTAAGWVVDDAEALDPTVDDVHLVRGAQGRTVNLLIGCMDNGRCEVVAGLD